MTGVMDLELLERDDAGDAAGAAARLRRLLGEDSRRRLLCRPCGAAVSTADDRVRIRGAHVHRRVNPAGFVYEFGCFASAPGVEPVGDPTSEFSWFEDAHWVISVCRSCGAHLGWRFSGAREFHALILVRLLEEPEA